MRAETTPEISVLMPFHNAAETLGESIGSILTQTFTNFEVIAVDDFYNDELVNVLQSHNGARSESWVETLAEHLIPR